MSNIGKYLPEPSQDLNLEWLMRELYRIGDAINYKDGLWDDLRFPATAVNLPGLGSDPDVDSTYGGCYLFDSGSTEYVFFIVQLPHAWKIGSVLEPHVHWEKTSSAAGNVYWRLEYYWHRIGEVPGSIQTLNATTVVSGTPDDNTDSRHLITAFDPITVADAGISDVLTMTLSRIGGDAADTYGADARFLEFDIHIQTDQTGSEKEFIKDER